MTDQPLEHDVQKDSLEDEEQLVEEPAAEALPLKSAPRLRTTPTSASPPTSTTSASASRASRWSGRAVPTSGS